jgi:type I restriction enzyme S subunit
MSREWETVELGKLVETDRSISYGIVQPGQNVPDGVPIVRVSDIRNGRIATDNPLRVAADIEASYGRTRLRGGELLLTLVGTVGEAAIAPEEFAGWNTARAVAVIPVRKDIGAYWVQVALRSPAVREIIGSRLNTTVQATLNLRDVAQLPIVLPPPQERRAIAHILGALDDKIELNRRMGETLEAMARALFKSWFVDFDPVRAQAEGRPTGLPEQTSNLFPDDFEESELGALPRGWRLRSLGDVCERVAMGPFGSDIKTDNFVPDGVPVVRGSNLTRGFVEDAFVFVTEAKADELRNANAFRGDVVITHRGTLGQVGLIPERSRFPRYVVSQSQMLLSVNRAASTPRYVFDFLCSPAGQHALLANTSQTGVPAIARPTTSLRGIRFVSPPLETLTAYDRIVGSLYGRCDFGVEQSRTLLTLRDSLLPKLISGELCIRDAENAIEAA